MAERASSVTFVIRGPDLNKSMSRYLVERIEDDERIKVRSNTQVTGLDGERSLSALRIAGPDGEDTMRCAALFSFIGADPASGWLSGCAALDRSGFVLTDRARRTGGPGRPVGDARQAAAPLRDEPPRDVRRRRRPVGIDEASGVGGRRRVGCRAVGSRVPRIRPLIA